MKYLKKFEGYEGKNSLSDRIKKMDPKEVSKVVYNYLDMEEGDNTYYELDDIIRAFLPAGHPQNVFTFEEVLLSISNFLKEVNRVGEWPVELGGEGRVGSRRDAKRRILHIFSDFVDIYSEIEKESSYLTKEEIEDFFLDMKYKISITRKLNGYYNVNIADINLEDVVTIFNRILNVIGKRLPEGYTIESINMNNLGSKANIFVIISSIPKNSNPTFNDDDVDGRPVWFEN